MKCFPLSVCCLFSVLIFSQLGCRKGPDGSADLDASGGKKLMIAAIPKSTGGEFWETV